MKVQAERAVEKSLTLRALVRSRGHKVYNLWQCYSHKHRADAHLPSDIALCHMVLLECDTTVAFYRFQYFPTQQHGSRSPLPDERLAEVEYKDGRKEWQEISRSAREGLFAKEAERCGFSFRLLTEEDIRSKLTLVWNGLLMLAVLAAAQEFSTLPYRNEIAITLLGKPTSIADLRQVVDGDEGLALAGLFELVIAGNVELDLESRPLSDLHLCRYRRS